MARKRERILDPQNKYLGKVLVDSKIFADCAWAASVVLKPNEEYTEAEAWEIIEEFLDRRVG